MKRLHVLRIRRDDDSPWSEPEYFDSKRERDKVAAFNRVLGGIRTHSYQESKAEAEARAVLENE